MSFCFAAQLTLLRKFHATVDMLPQVMIAGMLSLVIAFALAPQFAASGRDLAILALMGCVQLGTGCLLATAASKHLSATELGLLALLEPILGPIWVWALMGENPGARHAHRRCDRAGGGARERGVRCMARARRGARTPRRLTGFAQRERAGAACAMMRAIAGPQSPP